MSSYPYYKYNFLKLSYKKLAKKIKKLLRIFHAPTIVGGNPSGLSAGEKTYGYKSYVMALSQNYLQYEADFIIFKDNKISLLNEISRWCAAFKALLSHDVFHYNFGQSILPIRAYPQKSKYSALRIFLYCDLYCRFTELLDLKLAHFLKKVVVMTYQGDDARQGDYCRKHYQITFANEVGETYYNEKSDALKRARIRSVDKYADIIYSVNPDLLNVLPGRAQFLPYASVDPEKWQYIGVSDDLSVPHVVHAPSHRDVKGTQYILQAFEQLQKDGISFRYSLVENMSQAEAKKIYESADILVDQVLAGYYGAVSVECMALGKPVMCYMREDDMHYLPEGMWKEMPVINVEPATLYSILKSWLSEDKDKLAQKGAESRQYVEKWHDPKKIARRVLDDYERIYAAKQQQRGFLRCAE